MSLTLYRLRPLAPLHLGTGRADDLADLDELPRSDTLAAALCSVWRHVRPDADVSALAAAPPFALSSALPVVKSGDAWLPTLSLPVGLADAAAGADRKRWKGARFAPAALLRDLLAGRAPDADVVDGVLLPTAVATAHGDGLWHRDSRVRLAVNRLGDGPIPGLLYEFGGVRFADGVRLGVAVRFADEAIRPAFEAALALLGEEGLGADRSSGYGRFAVEAAEAFAPSLGTGMRLCLSLCRPTRDEIARGLLAEPARWDTVVRGGWVTSPGAASLRKRDLRMLTEGAMVQDLGADVVGDAPPVLEARPELGLGHDVYRSGVAIAVPIAAPAGAAGRAA